MIPELTTERLLMRAFREDDFPSFARFYADESTAQFVGGVCSTEDAWRRMATFLGHWSLRGYGLWALQSRETGAYAGHCGAWFPHGWPEPKIGWGLLQAYHGVGLATEAARRALGHVYGTLGWRTAVSCIALENSASIRVAQRLGATLDRIVENRGWTVGVYRYPAPSIA